jgi:hypothetical protein
MPTPQLQAMSKRYGVPMQKMEQFWARAKAQYGGDWEAVAGAVKRMAQNYAKSRGNHL